MFKWTISWPVRGFPATQRETRGSPALCVSGSFQGNQRVFGAPFCFSRVSLGKLASFPESESWSGAKSGAKLRKSARYPGILQVYRGFPGIPAKYPVFCRFWPQNSLRHGSEPTKMTNSTEFPRGFPRKLEGVVGKQAGNTERKPGRVREETLVQAKAGRMDGAARLRISHGATS